MISVENLVMSYKKMNNERITTESNVKVFYLSDSSSDDNEFKTKKDSNIVIKKVKVKKTKK